MRLISSNDWRGWSPAGGMCQCPRTTARTYQRNVVEVRVLDREPGSDRRGGLGFGPSAPDGDQLVLRIGPRQAGHRGRRGALHLQVVCATVGGDDEVGRKPSREGLYQDVRLSSPVPLVVSPNRPAHGVAGRNRHDGFARPQGDVRHPLGRCEEAVEHPKIQSRGKLRRQRSRVTDALLMSTRVMRAAPQGLL